MSDVSFVYLGFREGDQVIRRQVQLLNQKSLDVRDDPEQLKMFKESLNLKDKIEEPVGNSGENTKIDAVIYEGGLPAFTIYKDAGYPIAGKYANLVKENVIRQSMTTKEKLSTFLREAGNGSFTVYDFSEKQNGPIIKDQVTNTEEVLKAFLKKDGQQSKPLPNPGLGGRLSGLTGIEVMERSQMLDRVKTAG
ncbi:hypothetical protein [Niveispirillum sp. BGYR6]|uniref:hypothetical protein n=1 Tax=Niveispirillum sp. BGYR6 TaxID=2971249 RepID=UPI0022B99C76|nr:hypothetical protein [Niveispirillum sp. BGYR6]MDG5494146.1 hypothetical protein [Niveispirillum sp. BGYR6]